MHPTRPILFSFDSFGERFLKLRGFEYSAGLGAILMDAQSLDRLRKTLPDSNAEEDPIVLPEALRYYLCDGTVEGSVKCNDSMRNFVCYVDDEIDRDVSSSSVATPKVCRENKFQTKPDW